MLRVRFPFKGGANIEKNPQSMQEFYSFFKEKKCLIDALKS
jgi:hypothetical protein